MAPDDLRALASHADMLADEIVRHERLYREKELAVKKQRESQEAVRVGWLKLDDLCRRVSS